MQAIAAAGHEIVLVTFVEAPIQDRDFQQVKIFCSRIYTFPLSKFLAIQNICSHILSKGFLWKKGRNLAFQIAYFQNKGYQKQIEAIIEKEKPAHIYCHLTRMSEYVRHSAIPKTLDFMDAFGAGTVERAKISPLLLRPFWRWEARQLLAYEQAIQMDFDHTTIISEQDKRRLPPPIENSHSGIVPKPPTVVIPNGVDTQYFSAQARTEGASDKPEPLFDLAFIGNLGYYSNVEAARFLVKNILPLLQHIPNLSLQLVGARPTAEMLSWANEQVSVLGWQEDIRGAYRRSKILVAPLMHGIGQQNKILEAMAMGVPVITTSRVNNAIGATIGTDILVADTEGAFAKQIERLLEDVDLQKLIAKNGRDFVEKFYAWTGMTARLLALFTPN